jgi:hypothetical protein
MGEPVAAASIPLSGVNAQRVARWFYISIAVMMILFNAVAFAPPLLDPSFRREPLPLTPLVAAHAAVSISWLVLFLVQAGLVATRRIHVHRRLGILGAVLAVAFVVLGSLATIEEARRGHDLAGNVERVPPPPGSVDSRAAQLSVLLLFFQFAVLVGAALWYRTRPAIHRRLMSIALLGALTQTPVAHTIGSWIGPQQWTGLLFPISGALFLSLILLHDHITEGRVHPLSLWVSALVFGSSVLFDSWIVGSSGWLRLSDWLLSW